MEMSFSYKANEIQIKQKLTVILQLVLFYLSFYNDRADGC